MTRDRNPPRRSSEIDSSFAGADAGVTLLRNRWSCRVRKDRDRLAVFCPEGIDERFRDTFTLKDFDVLVGEVDVQDDLFVLNSADDFGIRVSRTNHGKELALINHFG